MDTDNRVVKAKGGVAELGGELGKGGERGDFCNSANRIIKK